MNKIVKIHWLIPGFKSTPHSLISSDIASIRLRAGVVQSGFINSHVKFNANEVINDVPDILIIGKISASDIELRGRNWLNQIIFCKKNGSKIILDYTDDHLNLNTAMTPFYKDCLTFVDYCVCSSNYLYEKMKQAFGASTFLIPDAIDLKMIIPQKKNNRVPIILWFGHASNIEFLLKFISKFNSFGMSAMLYVLTNQQGIIKLQNYVDNPPLNLNIKTDLWSLSSMITASSFCDICIIPSDIKNPKKTGASSNRLVTALALGMPVAANLLDSYIPYKKYFVNLDSRKDFISLVNNPESFYASIKDAQETIIIKYTPDEIFKKWSYFFESII